MRRLLTAILACIVLFITLGASAEASERGAVRAVQREVSFDYDMHALVLCDSAGRSRYVCDIDVNDSAACSSGHGTCHYSGRARVTQRGNRYVVNYRLYW